MSNNKTIIDCSTNTIKIVPLTPAEIAQQDQDEAEALRIESEKEFRMQKIAELKTSAKSKLISGQPLTEEEAEILLF